MRLFLTDHGIVLTTAVNGVINSRPRLCQRTALLEQCPMTTLGTVNVDILVVKKFAELCKMPDHVAGNYICVNIV